MGSVVTTQFPTTNGAHGSITQFTNPTRIYADDDSYATCTPSANPQERGNAYGTFGFDALIPESANITKVQLIYEYYVNTTTGTRIARVHSLVSGSAQANHDDTSEPTSKKVITVNVTADRTWTRANLLDGVLTVALTGYRNSSTSTDFSFDYVKVEVTWNNDKTGTATASFTGTTEQGGTKGATGKPVGTVVFSTAQTGKKAVSGTATATFSGTTSQIDKKNGKGAGEATSLFDAEHTSNKTGVSTINVASAFDSTETGAKGGVVALTGEAIFDSITTASLGKTKIVTDSVTFDSSIKSYAGKQSSATGSISLAAILIGIAGKGASITGSFIMDAIVTGIKAITPVAPRIPEFAIPLTDNSVYRYLMKGNQIKGYSKRH
jgi:hypothetical protein